MNTRKIVLNLGAVSLLALGASLGAAACSGDSSSNNPTPTQTDSGMGTDSTMMMGDDSSTGDSAATTDSSMTTDSGTVQDTSLPDVGNCMSDASNCNSCYTPSQDPLNACSPYTANCVSFDKTRVPSHPTL